MRGEIPEEIRNILDEIENNPSGKISDYTLFKKGIEPKGQKMVFEKSRNDVSGISETYQD